MERTLYENLTLDQERALYGARGALVRRCRFEGPADGESALKECRDVVVEDCDFLLRYPFWHAQDTRITHSRMTETCRAALWYDRDIRLEDCQLGGIKAVRECDSVTLEDCRIVSPEFGWFCRGLTLSRCDLTAEYPFLQTRDLTIDHLEMTGKYSFQYVENGVIRDSHLDTKDAFWHTKNFTVYDSVVKGEYLGWYSENLKLVRCKIIGTQPLCYCKGLVLEDCEMVDCDLAFENSEVVATVKGRIDSVKNPVHGSITADAIGGVILDENLWPGADCAIHTNE